MGAMSTATLRLSRRQVLGIAAGGALSAVGIRAMVGSGGPGPIASAAGSNGSWNSPLGDKRGLAAHVLRRAGFAYSPAELEAAAKLSYGDLVESLVSQQPEHLAMPKTNATQYKVVSQAWYQHMASTRAQFPERMTLFWHGLLTSDYRKGGNKGPLVWQQNELYRTTGLTDLRSLLLATTYDPLMADYLDLVDSTGKSPNENFARELMELYTLGVGNYSETDVREAARALSGLQIRIVDSSGKPVTPPKRDKNDPKAYYAALDELARSGARWQTYLNPRRHDEAVKTFLGVTGKLGPEQVIDTILSKDAAATFITAKALTFFSVPQPSSDYVARLAAPFRSSKYDIRTLMRTVFLSDEFKAGSNYRSLVRSPADFMISAMRALGRSDLAAQAVMAGSSMDQILYDPPTVAGWPTNAGWLSSSALLGRLNFAAYMVQNASNLPDPLEAVKTHIDDTVSADTAAVFNASASAGDRWYAILASPEFHLK